VVLSGGTTPEDHWLTAPACYGDSLVVSNNKKQEKKSVNNFELK
jgi:hypothetical protein